MRRHRVAVRRKVRSQRSRKLAAAACVGLLGAAAFGVLTHVRSQGAELLAGAATPRLIEVEGAPEPLRAAVLEFLAAEPSPRDRSDELLVEFPALAKASLSRRWLKKEHLYRVALKRAVAPAVRGGRPAGWLGEDGSVFHAPEGLFAVMGPRVDVGGAPAEERARAAAFLREAAASPALLSPLTQARHVSAADGWELTFEDGTTALWGDLRWTAEKLARLREVLLDARGQFPGALAADLRYFEDGRVLLRPAGLSARAGMR